MIVRRRFHHKLEMFVRKDASRASAKAGCLFRHRPAKPTVLRLRVASPPEDDLGVGAPADLQSAEADFRSAKAEASAKEGRTWARLETAGPLFF